MSLQWQNISIITLSINMFYPISTCLFLVLYILQMSRPEWKWSCQQGPQESLITRVTPVAQAEFLYPGCCGNTDVSSPRQRESALSSNIYSSRLSNRLGQLSTLLSLKSVCPNPIIGTLEIKRNLFHVKSSFSDKETLLSVIIFR